MKFATAALILTALSSTTWALSFVGNPHASAEDIPEIEPDVSENTPDIVARQNNVATLAPQVGHVQADPVYHGYLPPATTDPAAKWTAVVFTQTFAHVPDQLPTAGSGAIGLGTLTKNKRDVTPEETGIAGRVRV